MILAAAVIVGLLASLILHRRRAFSRVASISLRWAWLAVLALVLQWPLLRAGASPLGGVQLHQALYLLSYSLLLLFVWRNRRLGPILIVSIGVLLNVAVVLFNDGFMPITPETLVRINPGSTLDQWAPGSRYGYSKDIILLRQDTHLWALSDTLVVPPPFPWPTAFSVGDLVIAVGILVLMLAPRWKVEKESLHEP